MGALQFHYGALRDELSVVFKAHDPAPGQISRQENLRCGPAKQRPRQAAFRLASSESGNSIAARTEAQKHN